MSDAVAPKVGKTVVSTYTNKRGSARVSVLMPREVAVAVAIGNPEAVADLVSVIARRIELEEGTE